MESPVVHTRWLLPRRFLVVPLVASSLLVLATCAEDPVGPARGEARLRIVPVFASAVVPPLTIDRVHVQVSQLDPATENITVLFDNSFAFDADADQLTLRDIRIRMSEPSEDVTVVVELLAGSTVLFSGSQAVTLIRGQETSPSSLPLFYVGPGSNVASLVLGPRDTTIDPGAVVDFRLDAFDANGTPVPQYYASWSLVGGPATGARVNALGQLTAPAVPDTFFVKAVNTPTNVADSTRVIVGTSIVPPSALVWTGAVSTDWSTAGNWSPAQVPGPTDSVVIGSAPSGRQPTLTTTSLAGAVSIVAGGNLTIGGQAIAIARGFSTSGSGVLTMTNESDIVAINGDALFDGGNELGLLSGGSLSIGGNLTQRATNSGDSFHPSSVHVTALTGANPTLSFATPGLVPGTSHFQELAWVGQGTLTLATAVFAHGQFVLPVQGTPAVTSPNGSRLTVGVLATAVGVTFNNVPLTLQQDVPGALAVGNLTFQNMATNVSQLVVSHPGTGATVDFSNLTFSTTPVAPNGFYLDVTDVDGAASNGALTIAMVNPTPATPGAFVRATNGAQVLWGGSIVATWTGAVDNGWNTAGNWTPRAPGPTDDAVIPNVATQPVLQTPTQVRNLTVQPGAVLSLGTQVLAVSGNLVSDGGIDGTGAGAGMVLTGTGQTLRGNFDGNLVISGTYQLSGTLNFGPNGTGAFAVSVTGDLDLAGHTARITGIFGTTGTGTVRMASALDSLIVAQGTGGGGDVLFAGGSTSGRLTAGRLLVSTSLSQGGGDPAAFAPSPGHRTVVTGLATLTLLDTVNSGFGDLDLNGQTVQSASALPIKGTLFASGLSFLEMLSSNGVTANSVNVSSLTVQSGPFTIGGGTITRFDSVTFAGQPSTAAQLSIRNNGQATPFAFDALHFVSPPTTGVYVDANDLDGATGGVLTINLNNPNPATSGGFVRTTNGAVVNWPTSAPVVTWTGAVSTAWGTGGNWSSGGVPTATDSVVITFATNQPTLEGSFTVGAVVVTDGGNLSLGGNSLTVARGFATSGTGVLTGTTAGSNLTVGGGASFGGGSENGRLTTGTLQVAGNFAQTGGVATFVATGTHRTILNGTGAQVVTMTNPGLLGAHFQDLEITGAGAVDLGAGALVVAAGALKVSSAVNVTGGGVQARSLSTVAGSSFAPFSLELTSDTLLPSGSYGATVTQFDGGTTVPVVTYQQLVINTPGNITVAGNLSLAGLQVFSGSLVIGGRRVAITGNLTTADSGTITMTNAADLVIVTGQTGFGGGNETGRLTAGILRTSTGFFQDGTNSPASFAASGTHTVEMISSNGQTTFTDPTTSHFQNLRVLSVNNFPGDVEVLGNFEVNFNQAANFFAKRVTVGGNFLKDGIGFFGPTRLILKGGVSVLADAVGPDTLEFAGAAPQTYPASTFPSTVLVGSDVAMSGLSASSGADLVIQGNGIFRVGPSTYTVNGNLHLLGNGRLDMTDPASNVVVQGNATFAGGSTNGLLTNGVLTLAGDFTQSAVTDLASFAPSGLHTTVFVNNATKAVSMGSPGLGANGSHFQVLDVTGAIGGLTLDVNMQADSLISTNVAAKISSPGVQLTARRVQVFGLGLVNTTFKLDELTTFAPEVFSNVTFSGFPASPTNTTMLTVIGPGSAVAARPAVTTNSVNYQAMPVGANNFYVDLTSSNGASFNLNMTTSNQATNNGGNGAALTKLTPATGVATVTW